MGSYIYRCSVYKYFTFTCSASYNNYVLLSVRSRQVNITTVQSSEIKWCHNPHLILLKLFIFISLRAFSGTSFLKFKDFSVLTTAPTSYSPLSQLLQWALASTTFYFSLDIIIRNRCIIIILTEEQTRNTPCQSFIEAKRKSHSLNSHLLSYLLLFFQNNIIIF